MLFRSREVIEIDPSTYLDDRDRGWVPGRWRPCDQELGGNWLKKQGFIQPKRETGRLVANGRSVETQVLAIMLVDLHSAAGFPVAKRV